MEDEDPTTGIIEALTPGDPLAAREMALRKLKTRSALLADIGNEIASICEDLLRK